MNTQFIGPNHERVTWKALETKAHFPIVGDYYEQMDYFLIKSRWRKMIKWCGSIMHFDLASDHFPVIAQLDLHFATKQRTTKRQGEVFKPTTSKETKTMVNDILERWAVIDKPRTYAEWIHQYQEMLETLPRQEQSNNISSITSARKPGYL